jgi:phosphodiesterase/alkaline phosphatase D-like protein
MLAALVQRSERCPVCHDDGHDANRASLREMGISQVANSVHTAAERARPQLSGGVMSGDVTADRAIVCSRTDRPYYEHRMA